MADTFWVTPANSLAFEAAEASVRGDPHFARLLVSGPPGSGKSLLLKHAHALAEREGAEDIVWKDPLSESPGSLPRRIVATLSESQPFFRSWVQAFVEAGGRVVSLPPEPELALALARNVAAGMSVTVQPESLLLLAERLQTPGRVKGALQRLEAEAVLTSRVEIDQAFTLRSLGEFLFP